MQADFVIIGSGSAGSACAYRLSEDGKNTVIVIEAGGSDFGPFIQMPAALAWPMSMKRYNWGYLSEPEPSSQQPAHHRAARQGDRRLLVDQRHGLRARPCGGLQSLGRARRQAAGPMPTCCPISSGWSTAMAAKRAGAARTDRCMCNAASCQQPALPRLHRGRKAGRASKRRRTTTARSRKASG